MLTASQSLKNIFSERFDNFNQAKTGIIKMSEGSARVLNEDSIEVETVKDVQKILRPIFSKEGVVSPSIGGHPDYDHLRAAKSTELGSTTTLFMDIESSTRLGILYSPEDVYKIKNTFIRMAIDVIKALDGHVHRIMGDAVMAYFGRKDKPDEDGIVDALNCASVLMYIVKKSVIPKLEKEGFRDNQFGIRVGIDYGPNNKVLWSSYGHDEMDEVTATSFYVDVVSKLQSSAGRNQIMLGQSLIEFVDFYDGLLEVKKLTSNGKEVEEPFVKPNITDANGNKINYKKFHLMWEDYLKKTPFPVESDSGDKYLPVLSNSLSIRVEVYSGEKEECEGDYSAGSSFIDKNKWLKFSVRLNFLPQLPYTINFKVENHGKEASGAKNNDNHVTPYKVENAHQHKEIVHWEHTKYRGLQYMIVEVCSPSKVLHRVPFAIFIK